MKNISVLVDTNVLLDWSMPRSEFYDVADKIMQLCFGGKLDGCIAAHSFSNMFYILRKNHSVEGRRDILKLLCAEFEVVDIGLEKILLALADKQTADFEDALQIQCAIAKNADYIVTRNIKDFANSVIPPILPSDFLAILEKEES
ncbi:MAG: PIN domain-containing protein [Turicibacter sp.]|nr:PIN domain-containing protein [Turicibacter sp.]